MARLGLDFPLKPSLRFNPLTDTIAAPRGAGRCSWMGVLMQIFLDDESLVAIDSTSIRWRGGGTFSCR